jgi:hypothetical protein
MPVSHLNHFYDTRDSMAVTDSNPSNSPNTELTEVPKAAEIRYITNPNKFIDAREFEAPDNKGFETARWLISRAMLDPDAVVIPRD